MPEAFGEAWKKGPPTRSPPPPSTVANGGGYCVLLPDHELPRLVQIDGRAAALRTATTVVGSA
jgi:hypothetical protein